MGTSLDLRATGTGPVKAAPLFATLVLALGVTACSRHPANEVDSEVTTLGAAEVTAELVEIPQPFPPNDLYNYAFVMKYRVLKVHRGLIPAGQILVAQYNPLKAREHVQDDVSGRVGGHVSAFRAGDVHRMALASPLDQFWMGGIIDPYFNEKGTRYWAIWTNPGAK
jgi:hypothetical protein